MHQKTLEKRTKKFQKKKASLKDTKLGMILKKLKQYKPLDICRKKVSSKDAKLGMILKTFNQYEPLEIILVYNIDIVALTNEKQQQLQKILEILDIKPGQEITSRQIKKKLKRMLRHFLKEKTWSRMPL